MKLLRTTVALRNSSQDEIITAAEYLNIMDDLFHDIQDETGKPVYEGPVPDELELARGYCRMVSFSDHLYEKYKEILTATRLSEMVNKSSEKISRIESQLSDVNALLEQTEEDEKKQKELLQELGSKEELLQEKKKLLEQQKALIDDSKKLQEECGKLIDEIDRMQKQEIPNWNNKLETVKTAHDQEKGKLEEIKEQTEEELRQLDEEKQKESEIISKLDAVKEDAVGRKELFRKEFDGIKQEISEAEREIEALQLAIEESKGKRTALQKEAQELKELISSIGKEGEEIEFVRKKRDQIRRIWSDFTNGKPEILLETDGELEKLQRMKEQFRSKLEETGSMLKETGELYEALIGLMEGGVR